MSKQLEDLSRSINFSVDLMHKLEVRDNLTIEQKIILSIYRKLIEQIDGNFILADHQSRSPSIVMIRSALETYLSLKYITQQKKFIRDRSLCYYVGYLKNQKIVYTNILKNPPKRVTFSNENFEDKIIKIDQLLKSPVFKKVLIQWEITKNNLNKKFKNNHEPKWYSLFNGPTSIKQLVNKLNDTKIYNYYEVLSLEAHGYEALNGLNNTDIVNEPFSFKPIRNTENFDHFAGMAKTLCTSASHEVIKYMSPELNSEFIKFMGEIGVIEKHLSELKTKLKYNK
ncbi:hypothetical protein BC30048_4419 [Bacillus cereus]|uniref:DUF5677 domain-containing protein n=1 Tax=Bacillus cereus group TaxID=86661 RepID=UPI000789E848|nr:MULTISPECIES: DUF5677 domain-containing protein [Bacillus cereus group]KYQ00953.1 hypothetical protein B4079_3870 [Bacillus cereus]MED1214305.1 DUF5677 domain-containing protein [Bacillus paranthracis]BCC13992.1 hypothetical protein BCM0074_4375 [Bacillus cereus]BCD01517.1 hypothetical protein BC30048_4419 [Bacillus cereus]